MASETFWGTLNGDLQAELREVGDEMRVPSEHVLFLQGQPPRSVHIVLQGHVAVVAALEDGSSFVLGIRGAGEVLGVNGALTGEPLTATVRALSDVTVLDVPADKFMRFVNDRQLFAELTRDVMRQLREADAERAAMASLPVKSRFARLLVDLAQEAGKEVGGHVEIDLALPQSMLASRIGASREAVAKLLATFRSEGLVATGRRKLTVLSLDGLREIATSNR